MLCIRCDGTGKYLGNGMITTKCTLCDEDGNMLENNSKPIPPIDRKSKSYKQAIRDIMSINPDITRVEAVNIFNEAYDKD